MEGTQKKKGNTWLIVLLFIIILGLVGYIVYDKVLNTPQEEVEIVEDKVKKEDITNSDVAKNLHQTLITKNHNSGVYYSTKITPDKTDDERFIGFALADYINENNITLNNNIGGAPSEATNTYISKEDLNNFINKKYNNTLKYDLPLYDEQNPDNSKVYYLFDYYTFESYDGKWAITFNGEDKTSIYSKMTKAEQEGDYIYIYDNAAFCKTNDMFYHCGAYIDKSIQEELLTCSKCTGAECKNDSSCPTGENYTSEDVANVLLEKTPEKLLKYKHTFKKQDGNYYWVSSEVEQ